MAELLQPHLANSQKSSLENSRQIKRKKEQRNLFSNTELKIHIKFFNV